MVEIIDLLDKVFYLINLDILNDWGQVIGLKSLSKCARIPPSFAGGMNGLPSPLGGEGLPRGVIQNTPQGKGEGEMIL